VQHVSRPKGWGRRAAIRSVLAAGLLVSAGVFGCGSENDDGSTDRETSDGYSTDGASDGGASGDAAETDGAGDGSGNGGARHCGVLPEQLGPIVAGESGEIRGVLGDNPEIDPDCGGSIAEGGSAFYRVQVDEPVLFRAEAFGRVESGGDPPTDPVVEVHGTSCEEGREVEACAQGNTAQTLLDPGGTHHLWVRGPKPSEKPHFRLEWSSEQPACDPANHPRCTDGSLIRCPSADDRIASSCAESCASSEGCIGNVCGEARVVSASDSPVTVGGERRAYTGEWSAEGRNGCMSEVIETSGAEVFVRLEGVGAGDTVVFDSSPTDGGGEGGESSAKGESNLAFYVLESCEAESCLAAGRFDEDGKNRTTWTAETSGPHWLVAEILGASDEEASFEFDVSVN